MSLFHPSELGIAGYAPIQRVLAVYDPVNLPFYEYAVSTIKDVHGISIRPDSITEEYKQGNYLVFSGATLIAVEKESFPAFEKECERNGAQIRYHMTVSPFLDHCKELRDEFDNQIPF